jgi:toxin-antitoxin system PIN domain toxin
VIAVDTNILVYAHRKDSTFHDAAARVITNLAEGRASWAVPWTCIHEFLGVVTHPRIYVPPTPLAIALEQVEIWRESPSLHLLAENDGHWDALKAAMLAGKITGPLVHDARVAAICAAHGIRELWSADRDFSRFPDLTVRNPIV